VKVAAEVALGQRSTLKIFGTDYATLDGTCVRDYIHVSDLVSAHTNALRYLRAGRPSVTLNCGYGVGFSVLEVVDAMKRVSGTNFDVELAARREGDAGHVVADASLIRSVLGWKPAHNSLEKIASDAFAWERKMQLMRQN
jgi:UDP-glucose 4-epimerase